MNRVNIVLICSVATALSAQESEPFDKSTDLMPVSVDEVGRLPSRAGWSCFQACDRMVMKFEIRRVVGGGVLDVDVDANGALIRPEEFVRNGQISETATLKFKIESRSGRLDGWSNPLACSPYWLESEVWVNGKHFDGISVPYCNWLVSETKPILKVPVEALRFARRVEGSEPIPGINMIELRSGHASRMPIECGDHDSNWIGLASARFEATAPVVFVHGRTSNDGWFRKCGFDQEFRKKRIGYAFARGTQLKTPDRVKSLGDGLATSIAQIKLLPRLKALSREFGVPYFHLVAHSKGGLYSRAFLDLKPSVTRVGIYSLTTLATPHKGSVLSDLMYAANAAGSNRGNVDEWHWRGAWTRDLVEYLPSWIDVRTESLERWDQSSTFPFSQTVDKKTHWVVYRSQAADESLSVPRDCEGFERGCSLLRGIMGSYRRITLVRDPGGRLTAHAIGPGGAHDLAVSVDSASGPSRASKFLAYPRSSPWPRNHTTIGKADVGFALSALFTLEWERFSRGW